MPWSDCLACDPFSASAPFLRIAWKTVCFKIGTGGFEPPTSCASSKRSPPELRAYEKRLRVPLAKMLVKRKRGAREGLQVSWPA